MKPQELDPDGLYHLSTVDEWTDHRRAGVIAPPSLASEGFVHCSWGRQVPGTLVRHFVGASDILALRLDARAFDDLTLVSEDSYGSGEAFPHIYAAIPLAAVVEELVLDHPE